MSNRDLYVEKMKANLDSWNASIAKLEAQVKNAEADAKIKYSEQLEELKKQRAAANTKLEALRAAGDDAWEDMRTGLENAWDTMDKAMKAAASRFR
jgi:multidrug resistance efflux pump